MWHVSASYVISASLHRFFKHCMKYEVSEYKTSGSYLFLVSLRVSIDQNGNQLFVCNSSAGSFLLHHSWSGLLFWWVPKDLWKQGTHWMQSEECELWLFCLNFALQDVNLFSVLPISQLSQQEPQADAHHTRFEEVPALQAQHVPGSAGGRNHAIEERRFPKCPEYVGFGRFDRRSNFKFRRFH